MKVEPIIEVTTVKTGVTIELTIKEARTLLDILGKEIRPLTLYCDLKNTLDR